MNWTLGEISIFLGALGGIVSFFILVVKPFVNVLQQNQKAMKSLEKSIDALTYDLRDSQKDRENIHKVLDRHEMRIGQNEDAIIVNNERIATIFERGGKS